MGKRKASYKTKRVHFHGNRYSNRGNCSDTSSASKKKVKSNYRPSKSPETIGNAIFNIDLMFKEIERCLHCVCGGQVKLNAAFLGLGCKVSIMCSKCGNIGAFRNSAMIGQKKRVYAINRQIVYTMRCLGQGLSGIRLFCGMMDFPPPIKQTTYNLIVDRLLGCLMSVAEESMSQAADEEKALEKSNEIAVSCDGSWLTRGHTSQHGVSTVIGVKSGKVLDTEVLSLSCKSCQFWKNKKNTVEYAEWMEKHEGKCNINHTGTSGSMEAEGMKSIFMRSEKKHSVKYCKFIGDGDAKTYKSVSEMQPYGPDTPVVKYECVGHIQKRMGTRLRKLKADYKATKLSDGKSIAGKGRLTDSVIATLTSYYGNAIRANSSSVENMKQAVWAVWFHKSSTDDNPMHSLCPKGADSWCPYQKALHDNNLKMYKHKNNLPVAVMEAIKPIFRDLCDPKLLKRCVGGFTQNPNESFHSKIWKVCPKTGFYGRRVVQIGTYDAVVTFNDGMDGRLKVFERLEVPVGHNMIIYFRNEDMRRISSSQKKAKQSTKESRKARKRAKLQNEARKEEEQGVFYSSGQF